MKKVFIIDGNREYLRLFKEAGYHQVVNQDDADLLVFTGGSDVSPDLYGAVRHARTWSDPMRDAEEANIYEKNLKGRRVPCVGICRGGQFLNVMNGGTMYQDVTEHTRTHDMLTDDGHSILVTSTHHQMMKPGPKARLLAWATHPSHRVWWDTGVFVRDTSNTGFEVVRYDQEVPTLCFQPHPEMGQESVAFADMRAYFHQQVNNLF